MTLRLLSRSMLLMLGSGACLAHGELPSPGWCEGGRVIVVAHIELPGPALAAQRDECLIASRGPRRECGQFDGDYGLALRTANAQCAAHAWSTGSSDLGTVIFIAEGPSTYLRSNHHTVFRAEHGLSGTCVRCESLPVSPLPR
jgi:hypothetical protein